MKDLQKHLFYYVTLISIFILGALLTLLLRPNLLLQTIAILITIASYAGWGIYHHFRNHELTSKIVVEYVLIAFLGASILFFMIGGIL